MAGLGSPPSIASKDGQCGPFDAISDPVFPGAMIPTPAPPESLETATLPGAGEATHVVLSDDKQAARRRWTAAIALSIAINVILVAAIIMTLPPVPMPLRAPIPVHIVPPSELPKPKQQPPAPKPPPRPQPQAQQRKTPPKPPPGRLASEDLGDPKAAEAAKMASESKAGGPPQPEEGSEQPTNKGTAEKVEAAKPSPDSRLGATAPKPTKERKPAEKRGGSRVQAVMEPPHNGQHHAKYPGPDATKDAYLAYINELVRGCQTPEILSALSAVGRLPLLSIAVRHNGVILWVNILKSSGSPAFDEQYKSIFDCVGRFPPLPDYIPGATVNLTYGDSRDTP